MPITVNVLNTTSNYRTGIATCGIYFEKGQVTSTSQIITESGGMGFRDFGNPAYANKVQWEPFGVPHSDGSYRFAKASFKVQLDPNRERKVVMSIHGVGATPSYVAMPYDPTNLNIFNGVMFEFNFNGNYIYIPATQLTRVDTGDSEGCVRRYKLFTRPIASRRSLWVEIVVDVPTLGRFDAQGNELTATPITTANFWFRFGTSLLQRNTGDRNVNAPYAQEQNNCFFTENVTLTIFGCDSIIRFPEHIYGSSNVGTATQPAIRHILHNPSFPANNSQAMRGSASKMYRGVLLLGGETNSATAERQPASISPEISAIAEGWGRHMPPVFAEIPRPGNVATPSTPNYRSDWASRINTLLQRGYGQIRSKPHQSSPYGSKPNVSGAGDQGVYGNAYHHNPLYWLIQTAYPKELPYLIHGTMSNCFRGQWYYEEDGTPFRYENYPGMWMWSSRPFNGNGTSLSAVSPDTGGVVWFGAEAPQQKAAVPYNDWETYDREHASCQILAVAAILTADHFALEFCKMWAEVYGASVFGHVGNPSIDSWSADRASARTTQSLIPLYYATGSSAARVGIIKRYWLGKQTLDFWRNGVNARIDRLDFIEALKVAVPDGTTLQYILDVNAPTNGGLFSRTRTENPFFTSWQLSFVAVLFYQISKMFQDLYPSGAYLSNYQAGATINSTSLTLNDPGGNRVVVSKDTALAISRDLSATVIQHCTHFFGSGSENNWDWIELPVTGRTGLNSRTIQRLNECWPIGATVTGLTSGRTGVVHHVEAGDVNGQNWDWPVRVWLKNCSGAGFQTNSAGFITEQVRSSTGYTTSPTNQLRSLAGWYGTVAYSFDVNGTSHNRQRIGANYRVPLTKELMESYDTTRLFDVNILGMPMYNRMFKDYGPWQMACASICAEGVRANYYSTGDAVTFPVSRLLTKSKLIISNMITQSSSEGGDWDQTIIPYIGLMSNWQDSDVVDVEVGNLFQSSAVLGQITITAERFSVIEITPRQPVGVRLGSGALAYSYEIPQFTVFAEQATNITIKPLAVTDTRKDNVQAIRIFIDYRNSIGIYDTGTAELLPVDVITTRKPVGAIINKIIYLAIGSPPPKVRPVGIILNPDSNIPSEVEDPAIDYTELPSVVFELPSF